MHLYKLNLISILRQNFCHKNQGISTLNNQGINFDFQNLNHREHREYGFWIVGVTHFSFYSGDIKCAGNNFLPLPNL